MKVKLYDGEKWQELSGGGGGSGHTHPNLTLLNSITQAMVTAWQNAATWVTTNGANVLAHIADSLLHVPSGGTAGQVLTKTATGTEWATGGGGAEPELIATITGKQGDTGLSVTGLVGKKHLAAYIKNSRGSDIPAWLCFTVNNQMQYILNNALQTNKQMGIFIDVFGSRAHFECNVAQGYAYYDTPSRGNDVYSGWLQDKQIFANGITSFKFHTSGNADLAGIYMEIYAW